MRGRHPDYQGSWQAQAYGLLRDREWHRLGDLFEAVQAQIPLHTAMRYVMHPDRGRAELPTNSEARWRVFLSVLSIIGVDSDGNPKRRIWTDRVRLGYVAGRACDDCNGPVIKAGWSAGSSRSRRAQVACLACEGGAVAPASEIVAPVPPVQVVVSPPPQPRLEVTTVRTSPRWQYRAKRALAKFIKTTRLPSLSVSQILKQWDRTQNLSKFLLSQGKRPVSEQEYYSWHENYIRLHPP